MFNQFNKEKGSVTIEATISLSTFMFAIVTILTVVNICVVQARMSYAINMTAREISQYSYLYSLTGFNDRQKEIYENGQEGTTQIDQILSDVNSAYTEIENLGNEVKEQPQDIDDLLSKWDSAVGNVNDIQEAGSSLYDTISDIASDPKDLMFGIAKLAASETFDLAKSRLIAAPLAKTMIQKHLVDTKDGDVEAYLKFLGVVPSPTGSYLDGLDFSNSSLFPRGTGEIKVNVEYDVKIIALLPIDFTFHFNQTAITQGWVEGGGSFDELVDGEGAEEGGTETANSTIWTEATLQERTNFIRHLAIKELCTEGYKKTSGLTDVQLYSAEKNEFVMISSMNPLWSADGEATRTVADIDKDVIKESIEHLCGKMKSTTDGLDKVKTKSTTNGTTTKTEQKCDNASNKIVLVIPEDPGLKKEMETIIANANTNGVTIELVPGHGKGARTTKEETKQGGTGK